MAVTSAAVSALLKPLADHGRNSFPLDNKHVYSMKAGQITPVKCFHYEPESYFDIQAHDFSLTFPMQTAPFLRGRKEFSFYSVYYNAIWSLYNQYQGTRQNPKTSAFGNSPRLVEPRIGLFDIYYNVLYQFGYYLVYQHVIQAGFDAAVEYGLDSSFSLRNRDLLREMRLGFMSDAYRDHHIIGYKYPTGVDGSGQSFIDFSHTFVYSYNSNGVFSFYDGKLSGHQNEEFFCDIVGHPRVYSWLRKLDMLGYGNFYPFFNYYERRLISRISGLDMSSYLPDGTAIQRVNAYVSAVYSLVDSEVSTLGTVLASRLLLFSNDSDGSVVVSPSKVIGEKYSNLYSICAYNSVFYHFFRNSFYDNQYSSHDYSLDFVSVVTTDSNDLNLVYPTDFTLRFLDIEYHQWKKDVFTGVLPDTQYGAVSSVDVSFPSHFTLDFANRSIQDGSPVYAYTNNANPDFRSLGVGGASRHFYMTGDGPSSFDVISLKRAEMLQQYRQTLMRAGNKTSDVFKAIYGSSPSSEHEEDIVPRFLDTFGEDIFVDPVISQSNTGSDNPNGQLGDIAARAKFSGDSGHIKFNSGGNFGCIICFAYVVPTAEYNSCMFDKHIFELTPEQHYIPQFGNYGLIPIYSDELNCFVETSKVAVLGFTAPYYHKKSEVDQVHGAFCSFPSQGLVSQGTSIGGAASPRATALLDWFGDFNNWVSPRSDMQFRNMTSVRDFYINPSVLDNVFVRAAGADQADDQFICNTYFDVKAVKSMSKSGLINFV